MIFNGISFTIVTGIIWTMLAVIYSGVASKQKSIVSFMFFSTVFFALLIWIFRFPREISSAELGRVALAMIPAGLCGIAGFQMLFWAMRKGSHAVAWTFTQSAMVLPFLGGWLIFHQAVKWFKNKKRWYKKGSTPKLGDQVYYDFKRKKPKYATHTGRIISVNTKKHTCVAEEGNVSNTTKKRCFNYLTYKYLLGFGRPFYK